MKKKTLALLVVCLCTACGSSKKTVTQNSVVSTIAAVQCVAQANGNLPDPTCTPGVINPNVTQSTINNTICVSGWTSTVRPSESVTEPEKYKSMAQYGIPAGNASKYEYDHLIPLEVGGAVNDTKNLWPESHSNSFIKDAVENKIKRLVCEGKMTLAAGQAIFTTDWRTGEKL